jgi:hypothetical protein
MNITAHASVTAADNLILSLPPTTVPYTRSWAASHMAPMVLVQRSPSLAYVRHRDHEGGNQEANGNLADMLFQGEGEAFNVGAFLESISPYAWASTGIGLCIGLSVIGAAWSVYTTAGCMESEAETRRWHLGESLSQAHPSSEEVSRHHGSGRRI